MKARTTLTRHHKPAPWWASHISSLRKECLRARRSLQRTRGTDTQDQRRLEFNEAERKTLKTAIRDSKRNLFLKLCDEAEHDPWGQAYKIVSKKVRAGSQPPSNPVALSAKIDVLFPSCQLEGTRLAIEHFEEESVEAVTAEEVLAAARNLAPNKAAGPDAVPNRALKNAFNTANWLRTLEALKELRIPEYLMNMVDSYLSDRILLYDTREGQKDRVDSARAPQGSVLGPLLRNTMYDGVFRLPMAEGSIITTAFARYGRPAWTVSDDAALVIEGLIPIKELVRERKELANMAQDSLSSALVRKRETRATSLSNWQRRWEVSSKGRWTFRLAPDVGEWTGKKHGQVYFYLTQALSGHGCFRSYLKRFGHESEDCCPSCGSGVTEDPLLVLFDSRRFEEDRLTLEEIFEEAFTPSSMVPQMLQTPVK
ncbi:uncharacterized protein [Drosophila bipectinata]|uniref:uncharacterized protein n=1 Tax=Drosophila bipectinata TaxID=42026 RepID=UPI0038B3CC25